MASKKDLRHQTILEQLVKLESTSVEELCGVLGVSEATIRRDLADLENEKKLQRVFGGAKVIDNYISEMPILSRMNDMKSEKMRIGKAAAQMVKNGDAIFISSGSTPLYMIPYLESVENLTVITNSLPVIEKIVRLKNRVNLICIGGIYRASEQSFLGKMAVRELQALRASKLFIGVRAIHPVYGLTNDAMIETQVDHEIIKSAENIIIMADHSKFNRLAPVFLMNLNEAEAIITDDGLELETKEAFKEFSEKIKLV